MSPASKRMFEGEPRHLVMVLLSQDPIGLLSIQEEGDDVGQGRDQDPSHSGVAGRDMLDCPLHDERSRARVHHS